MRMRHVSPAHGSGNAADLLDLGRPDRSIDEDLEPERIVEGTAVP